MSGAETKKLRFVAQKRRPKEDRRFVAGAARYAADIDVPGMKHMAVLGSPYPAARIRSIDATKALAMPGVLGVITGEEFAASAQPLMSGLDIPEVRRFPLAVGQARYAGEWVAALVADSRALAEDAIEAIEVEYERLPFVLDAEEALDPASTPVHAGHKSNVLFRRTFRWGPVDEDFAAAEHQLEFRVVWGRNSTVPIETFQVTSRWNDWREELEVWASIQMPKYPEQIAQVLGVPASSVRVHYDVDVGGSYGVKRGIKHTVLTGFASRKLGVPVRLIEDRLENMRAGDAHGPDRIFDVRAAFDGEGRIRAMKMRALDNAGAYAGRAPLQLGKPVGAIVGPYQIQSVEYEAISVTTNKGAQEAVRGFGQSPTNYAIETMVDRVARHLKLDPIEVRRRNFVRADQFPYVIPSGAAYDSGDFHTVLDKVLAKAEWPKPLEWRDALRAEGRIAGLGFAACLEPSGGNSAFEPLFNEKNKTTTWMEGCRVTIDMMGTVTVNVHTTASGQGHETLAATVVGEVLEIDPDRIKVVRDTSQGAMPTNSPVGSRMAVMLGGAAHGAAMKLRDKLIRIGARKLGLSPEQAVYSGGDVLSPADAKAKAAYGDLVLIAHRYFHELPEGDEPGLVATRILQVPTGGALPTEDGRVQMYPCTSFEMHLIQLEIDRDFGLPRFHRYVLGHDCGTVINPDIVRGMSLGGVAHGVGAALYEEFAYDGEGQLMTQSFMDYLLPSVHEIPRVEIVKHCTPSPHTVFGQKGSGESGYLGAPAAISNAVNDALAPLGASAMRLPMRASRLSDIIADAREAQ